MFIRGLVVCPPLKVAQVAGSSVCRTIFDIFFWELGLINAEMTKLPSSSISQPAILPPFFHLFFHDFIMLLVDNC